MLLHSLRKGIVYSTATGRMLADIFAAPAAPTHATSSTPFLRASKGHIQGDDVGNLETAAVPENVRFPTLIK